MKKTTCLQKRGGSASKAATSVARKFISCVASLTLALALVPAASLTAFADDQDSSAQAQEIVLEDSQQEAAGLEAQEATQEDAQAEAQENSLEASSVETASETSWYDASATSLTISTAAQLTEFAQIVNGTHATIAKDNFAGKTVTLANDIAVAADNLYTTVENVTYGASGYPITTTQYYVNADATRWTPIGSGTATGNTDATTTNAFAGTFDGAGHTVSGIYIGDGTATTGNTNTVAGLFGVVSGTIKNVTVSGCITAKIVAGGVVAHLQGGTVENCTNKAIVFADGGTTPAGGVEDGLSGGGAIGGIAGNAATGSKITGCTNSGTIVCVDTAKGGRAGGIFGLIDGSDYAVTISNCANTGTVMAYQYAGGIVGMDASTVAPITGCSNTGTITTFSSSRTYVSGIVAKCASDISNCYNTGTIEVRTLGTKASRMAGIVSDFSGTAITNCYSTGSLNYYCDGTLSYYRSSFGMICGTGYGTSDSNKLVNCYALDTAANDSADYPAEDVKAGCVTTKTASEMTGASFATLLGDAYTADANGNIVLSWQATEPGPDESWYNTKATVLYVRNYAELAEFAQIVNGTHATIKQDSFRGKTVKLATDIDMGGVYDSTAGTWSGTSWTPIGNATYTYNSASESTGYLDTTGYAFEGTFDGQGHKLTNLYISAATGYLGLFGAVGGTETAGAAGYGTVKNFTIESGYVTCTSTTEEATDYVGAVVAKLNAGGTIEDVVNNATVYAPYTVNVGGIVGFAGTPTHWSSNDRYAVYKANPSGSNTLVQRCGNNGNIAANYKGGGIVGENAAKVLYCYNAGKIQQGRSGSGGSIGGIVGRNGNNNTATEEGTVMYCYNAGTICGTSVLTGAGIRWYGGIAGWSNLKSKLMHNYAAGVVESTGHKDYQAIVGRVDGATGIEDNYSLDTLGNYYTDTTGSYGKTNAAQIGIQKTSAQLKTTTYNDGDILTLLSPAFVADSATNPINGGYPVLYWQTGAEPSTPTALTIATAPTKTEYTAGQTFDTTGMVLKATYSDGSTRVVSVADCSYKTDVLATTDTSITFSYTYGGKTVTASQSINVIAAVLTSIAVTTAPNTTIYAADETFDKTGMVVTASYNDGAVTKELAADAYTVTEDRTNKKVTISYTEGEVTKTCEQAVEFLSCNAPSAVEGVYQITTTDELTWFSVYVNMKGNYSANAKIVNDIAVSSAYLPLGNYKYSSSYNAYTGTFDGNNKTLTFNINSEQSYVGLIACLGAGTVKDLTIDGSITTTKTYAAGIACVNVGGAATIDNCVNNANITAAGNMAGILAYSDSSAAATVVNNCTNNGAITANDTYGKYGGIVGGYVYANVKNCTNNGVIASKAGYTGGIAGGLYGVIDNCVNNAAVTSTYGDYVGGIVGYFANQTTATVSNCVNKGAVTGAGSDIAGVVGYSNGSYSKNATIENCMNYGEVSASGGHVAGVVGYISKTEVKNCGNVANVTYTGTATNKYAGGVVGEASTKGSAATSYNTGTVTGVAVGGILGHSYDKTVAVTDCYNAGAVVGNTESTNGAGGICGYTDYGGAFTNCYNTGSITGYEGKTGAIIGYVKKAITFENCSVLGDSSTVLFGSESTVEPTLTDCAAKSSDEMKSADFLTALGESFKADGDDLAYASANNGYPILSWQTLETAGAKYDAGMALKISESGTIRVGDTFTVNVLMTSNQDISSGNAALSYDKDALTLVSVTAGEGLSEGATFLGNANGGNFGFSGNTASFAKVGGVAVASYTFEAKAAADSVAIKLTSAQMSASGVIDDIEVTIVSEEATDPVLPANATKGDVNNNGKINVTDAQIVYDFVNGVYGENWANFPLSNERFAGWIPSTLNYVADVQGTDGVVDAVDAYAILCYTVYGTWTVPETA